MTHLEKIHQKIHDFNSIEELSSTWRSSGEQVVFTNGCFDLLHLGHITYLSQAADLGTKLVIGVNTDSSVRRLDKSPSRPIKEEDSRLLILASLDFVSAVVLFDEDTPLELISRVRPNVLVKGGDYDPESTDPADPKYIVGSDVVKRGGGEVRILQFVPGYSTTKLENKILETRS